MSPVGPGAPTSCEELVCSFGASCIEVNGQSHCECPSPDCDEKNKTKVRTVCIYYITTWIYWRLAPVSYGEFTCVPISTPSVSVTVDQVCGSDGVTYADQCHLRTIACRQDKDVTVQYFGQCTGETRPSLHASAIARMAPIRT